MQIHVQQEEFMQHLVDEAWLLLVNLMIYLYSSFKERSAAVEMGQHLIDEHFGHHVKGKAKTTFKDSDSAYYRLLEDDESNALNAGDISECKPRPG